MTRFNKTLALTGVLAAGLIGEFAYGDHLSSVEQKDRLACYAVAHSANLAQQCVDNNPGPVGEEVGLAFVGLANLIGLVAVGRRL